MLGIISDHDIEGYFRALISIWEKEPWREIWKELGVTVESFASLGISPHINDADLWHACQARELVLFTANRNDEGPDSLEATIRRYNQETCLPVITIADLRRFARDRGHAAEVAERALGYLLEMENYRGTGRIFV
jgi:hypothetical protein